VVGQTNDYLAKEKGKKIMKTKSKKICPYCRMPMTYKGRVGWTGDGSLPSPVKNCAGPFSDGYICPRCGHVAHFCIGTQRKWKGMPKAKRERLELQRKWNPSERGIR